MLAAARSTWPSAGTAFVAGHAREAFNFNLTMFLYACALCVVAALLVGATVFTLGLGLC